MTAFVGTRTISPARGPNRGRQTRGALSLGTTPGTRRFQYMADEVVRYADAAGAAQSVTFPAKTPALVWDTDAATSVTDNVSEASLAGQRYVVFTPVGDGTPFWAPESALGAILAAQDIVVTDLVQGPEGWRQWQSLPITAVVVVPPTGCFSGGATLQLVAGGTIGDTTYTDGALGTNTTSAPFAMALNPVDGLLYFNDGQFSLRTLNLDTLEVATSAFSNGFASGGLQTQHSGMVFSPAGLLYQWGDVDNDTHASFLFRYLADGTFDTELLNPAVNLAIYTDPTTSYNADSFIGPGALGISPDGTRIYFCAAYALEDNQSAGGRTSFIAYYDVTADIHNQANFLAGVINPTASTPSAFPSPTTTSTKPAGTDEADQGEGAAGDLSLLGNVVGLCVDPATGDVYSVANDVNMVRKTTADGSSVVSLSNHDAIPFSGSSPSAWPSSSGTFGGDGSTAFAPGATGYPGGQFSFAQSICLTDCGGQLVVDAGNQAIRHIDPSGILRTVAGDPAKSGMPYPTSTPSDALACQIHPATILQLGSGKYLISQVGDGASVPDALYMLQDASPPTPPPWTIQLVAGGTTMASLTGGFHGEASPAVDGALGTNTLYAPQAMAYASDGKLWFLDGLEGNLNLRTYDPSTGLVASRFSLDGDGGALTQCGIALDGDDNVWVSYTIDADSPFAGIRAFTPDGTTVIAFVGSAAVGGPLPPGPTTIGFSPDFARLYYAEGRDGLEGISYFNPNDALFTGGGVDSVTSFSEVPFQTVGLSVDADGNVYTVGYDQGGAVRVTPAGTVTNLTNIASGQGFSGDGSPGYTSGDTTPQLAHPSAISYDPVSDTIAIVDHDNFVIRALDHAGILWTIAGTVGLSGGGLGDFPDATPAPALTKGLGGSVSSIIPAPGGGFYVSTGSDIDAEGVDGIWAIYLLLPPDATAGSGAGLDVLTVSGGAVTGITVSAPGSGYHFPLRVVFTPDPSDTTAGGASAHITGIDPSDGSITGIALDSGGSGYAHLPTATVV